MTKKLLVAIVFSLLAGGLAACTPASDVRIAVAERFIEGNVLHTAYQKEGYLESTGVYIVCAKDGRLRVVKVVSDFAGNVDIKNDTTLDGAHCR